MANVKSPGKIYSALQQINQKSNQEPQFSFKYTDYT